MAVWTVVPDSAQLPDQPIKSSEQIAIKNNITALAEGASGAPKIQNAAMDTNSVDNDNVVGGTLGAEKFQTGTTERDWVLARTAGAVAGNIGTYGLFKNLFVAAMNPGDTVAGSNIEYSSADGSTATTASGTWRAMGFAREAGGGFSDSQRTTVFLRIS